MATQTGSIDLKAAKKAHEEASRIATNYVQTASGGIWVTPSDKKPDANGNPISTTRGVRITDQIDIFRGINSVSAFGDTVRVGKDNQSHVNIDYHSLQLVDKERRTYFWVSDLRDESGLATMTDYFIGNGTQKIFQVENKVTEAVSAVDSSHPSNTVTISKSYEKDMTFVSGQEYYTLVGTRVTAPTEDDFAIYYQQVTWPEQPTWPAGYSKASPPFNSNYAYYTVVATRVASPTASNISQYYFGIDCIYTFTTAPSANANIAITYKTSYTVMKAYTLGSRVANSGLGAFSVAEGENNVASARDTHVEGSMNKAIVAGAHVEGLLNTGGGQYTHVEGVHNIATGYASHAEGYYTIATSPYEHVQGKYNKDDRDDEKFYLFVIGNGTSDSNRSNALSVDWDGNIWTKGTITTKEHASPIGTLTYASKTVSIASGSSWSNLASITLKPGSYIVSVEAYCGTLASGKRLGARLYVSTTSTEYNGIRSVIHTSNTAAGAASASGPIVLDESNNSYTVYVQGFQTQGSAQDVIGYIRAMRIA